MTAGPTLTEVQLPPKEPTFSSSRLLSKIARSPTSSRRHRPLPSQGSGSDTVSDQLPPTTQGAVHSKRNQPRPAFSRQVSAPDTSVRPFLREDTDLTLRHHSDTTDQTAQQAQAMLTKQQSLPQYNTTNVPLSTRAGVQGNMFSAPLVSEYYNPGQLANGGQALNYMYQQLYELSQKRISTLQYMRRAHEGKMFWMNTVHFSKSDISRLPSYMPSRLARRATNYFLLGISIPTVLDVHQIPQSSNAPQTNMAVALEFLKSLNTLLSEFEHYQEKHPTDGSHASSLGRARLPSMFKRSATTARPRKSSTAPSVEIGAQISPPAVPDVPHHAPHPSIETTASTSFTSNSSSTALGNPQYGGILTNQFTATATFPPPGPSDAPNSSLLPSEAPYTHLLTPPLPFAPDFYSVFANLCDVLIDTYQRLLQIINSSAACSATVVELFSKTDAKLRKVMVGGIIRDFEAAARETAKRELNGVQKVVLSGLMG